MVLAKDVQLHTADEVRLHARHWDAGLRDLGCVVAHGFTGSSGAENATTPALIERIGAWLRDAVHAEAAAP